MSDDANIGEGYRAFHAPRYAYLLRLLESLGVSEKTTVLDIGPSYFTELARKRFGTRVDTLGFNEDKRHVTATTTNSI